MFCWSPKSAVAHLGPGKVMLLCPGGTIERDADPCLQGTPFLPRSGGYFVINQDSFDIPDKRTLLGLSS